MMDAPLRSVPQPTSAGTAVPPWQTGGSAGSRRAALAALAALAGLTACPTLTAGPTFAACPAVTACAVAARRRIHDGT